MVIVKSVEPSAGETMMDDHSKHSHAAAATKTAIDPVCQMVVDPATARSAEVRGQTYYFCSEGCRTKFVADPDKYLNAKPFVLPPRGSMGGEKAPSSGLRPPSPPREKAIGHDHAHHDHGHHDHVHHGHVDDPHPAASPPSSPNGEGSRAPSGGAKYTCPMHPQIVQDGPGFCPLCGMALEPAVASLDDGPNPELVDFTRRLIVSAALSVPILVSEQYPQGLGGTDPRLRLPPTAGIIAKTSFSALSEPAFRQAFERLNRSQVILCGMEAHVCVLQTALELCEAGHHVFVVADAVGSRREESRALGLARMRDRGVDVVDSEMVVFEWAERAGTDQFRELSRLIK